MGCSAVNCLKRLLVVINFIFIVIGVTLIGYGVYQMTKDDYVSESSVDPNLISGVIIFVIALFGFCGALRESYCLLITYSIILILLFISQLVFGIWQATSKDDDIRPMVKTEMAEMLENFNNNTYPLNYIQETFHCCGVNDIKDFEPILGKNQLPQSCCEEKKYLDDKKNIEAETCTIEDKHYTNNCVDTMTNLKKAVVIIAGLIAIGLGLVYLLGAIISIILARSIKNHMRRRYP